MQKIAEEKLIPLENLFLEAELSQQFLTHLNFSNDLKIKEENEALDNHGGDDEEAEEEEEDKTEEEEEEFAFFCGGANTSPIAADDIFIDGQIKPIFPFFNRGEDLPMKKLFVEMSEIRSMTSSNQGNAGSRKAVEVSPEICEKSNSTGSSKIWKLKGLVGRSNSDGRDTYVFLNKGHAPVAKGDKKKKKGLKERVKGKTASLMSPHEVYLKSKATKEERQRSYLPYRPGLMGFFTNLNGGLSKNVHPF